MQNYLSSTVYSIDGGQWSSSHGVNIGTLILEWLVGVGSGVGVGMTLGWFVRRWASRRPATRFGVGLGLVLGGWLKAGLGPCLQIIRSGLMNG